MIPKGDIAKVADAGTDGVNPLQPRRVVREIQWGVVGQEDISAAEGSGLLGGWWRLHRLQLLDDRLGV